MTDTPQDSHDPDRHRPAAAEGAAPTTPIVSGDTAADFSAIELEYGPQVEMHAMINETVGTAMGIRAQRAATKRRIPMPVLRTISDFGTGKTTGAEMLAREMNAAAPGDGKHVHAIIATLDTTGTQASVPQAILRALKKPRRDIGKPATLWMRANAAMREHDVRLVMFDEWNRTAKRPSIGETIGGDIMDLLVEGEAAVVFLCTAKADPLFNRAPALNDRLRAPVIIKALDWLVDDDKDTFITFIKDMDNAMADLKLIPKVGGLDAEPTARMLWDVSQGRLRPLCLLLEEALTTARRRSARSISIDDLAAAVETISMPQGHIAYNPFAGESPE